MITDRFARDGEPEVLARKKAVSTHETSLAHDLEPLLDSEEAAKRLRIHPKTLQRYARQGYVHGFQIGTMWRFRVSDLERWIAQKAS